MASVLSPSTSTYVAGKRLLSSPQDAFASPVDKKSRQYDNESNNMDYSECSQQRTRAPGLFLNMWQVVFYTKTHIWGAQNVTSKLPTCAVSMF